MNYLSKETIMNDIERFSQSIKENYSVDDCSVYIEQFKNTIWLGYKMEKGSKVYNVKMPYVQNELGDLSIQTELWSISENAKDIHVNLPSLKEVFEALNIQSNDQTS